jgi:membrane-associated phospholipid phosphatase
VQQLVLERPAAYVGRMRRAWPWAALALVSALVFARLCDDVGERDGLTRVDPSIAQWFGAFRTPLLDSVGLKVAVLTMPAAMLVAVVIVSAVLWFGRARVAAVLLLGSFLLAAGAGAIAKYAEHRARPTAPYNLAWEAEPSFPSGHVLVAATVSSVVVLLAWRHLSVALRIVAVAAATLFTLMVAVDRLVVGAHWFTDLVGSLSLAAAILGLAAVVERLLRPTT